jgi:hypothetical protein
MITNTETKKLVRQQDDQFFSHAFDAGTYTITGQYFVLKTTEGIPIGTPLTGGIYCNYLVDNSTGLYEIPINSWINLNETSSYSIETTTIGPEIITIDFSFTIDIKQNGCRFWLYFFNGNGNVDFTRFQYTISI